MRYSEIHTLTIKKFPFLVHYYFELETQTIHIVSILPTSLDPNIWGNRK